MLCSSRPAPPGPQVARGQRQRQAGKQPQHGKLDPQHAAGRRPQQGRLPQRQRAAPVRAGGKKAQHRVQRRAQQRQAEFLGAAAVGKGRPGRRSRAGHQHPGRVQRPGKQLGRAQAGVQKGRKGQHLDAPHAPKAGAVQQPADAVHQVQQRPLVVKHIPVQHLAVHHGLAGSVKDVGVHPVVQGVQRRRLGADRQQQGGGRKAPQQCLAAETALAWHAATSGAKVQAMPGKVPSKKVRRTGRPAAAHPIQFLIRLPQKWPKAQFWRILAKHSLQ